MRLALLAGLASLLRCNMAPPPADLTELVSTVHDVGDWRFTTSKDQRAGWLRDHVAWDVVGAVDMTWASVDLAAIDPAKVTPSLRSGLDELAAGPGDAVIAFAVRYAKGIGRGTTPCTIEPATDADAAWARQRLTLPMPPDGTPSELVDRVKALADRAHQVTDFQRATCGGGKTLLIGRLGDRYVTLLTS